MSREKSLDVVTSYRAFQRSLLDRMPRAVPGLVFRYPASRLL